MKKNYIAPSTVAATWASMGLMQDNITLGVATGSGGAAATLNEVNLID